MFTHFYRKSRLVSQPKVCGSFVKALGQPVKVVRMKTCIVANLLKQKKPTFVVFSPVRRHSAIGARRCVGGNDNRQAPEFLFLCTGVRHTIRPENDSQRDRPHA